MSMFRLSGTRPTGRSNTQQVLDDTVVFLLCRFGEWWVEMDSNHRPYAYQAYALTT